MKILSFILAFIGIHFFTYSHSQSVNIYVSTKGTDNGDASFLHPIKTIECLERVLNNAQKLEPDSIFIYFRKGYYEFSKPLIIKQPPDLRSEKNIYISFSGLNNEYVVLSGGKQLKPNWKKCGGERNNVIWSISTTNLFNDKWKLSSLFCNGNRLDNSSSDTLFTSSALPKFKKSYGIYEFNSLKRLLKDSIEAFCGFGYDDSNKSISSHFDLKNAKLLLYNSWEASWHDIESINSDENIILLQNPTYYPVGFFNNRCRFQIFNSQKYFVKPMQWYWNLNEKKIFLRCSKFSNPNKMNFVVPNLNNIIYIDGGINKAISNIYFKNIVFSYTSSIWGVHQTVPEAREVHFDKMTNLKLNQGFSTVQTSIACGESILVKNASNCGFETCTFTLSDNYGIRLGENVSNSSILNCNFYKLGGGGIIVGFDNFSTNITNNILSKNNVLSYRSIDCPNNIIIEKNKITSCGKLHPGTVGISIMHASSTNISKNFISDLPYSGISSGWWNNENINCEQNNVISFNHISNVTKTLADGGGIYTIGIQQGTLYKGNYIHDIYRSKDAVGSRNNGFFFDQKSKNFRVDSNVVFNIYNESLRYNTIDSNSIILKDNYFEKRSPDFIKANVLERIKDRIPYFNK